MPKKELFPAGLREVYEKPENQRDILPLARPAEHSLAPRLHRYHPDICLLLCASLAFPVPGTLLFSAREARSRGDRGSEDRTPAELPARICPRMLCLARGTNSRQGIKAEGK